MAEYTTMTVDAHPRYLDSSFSTPLIDFRKPPAEVVRYEFGDPLTRSNFTDFVTGIFARSRGKQTPQAYIVVWLERHGATNVTSNIDRFIEQGGWDRLTEEEKSNMQRSAEAVKAHREHLGKQGEETRDSLRWQLDLQLTYVKQIIEESGTGNVLELDLERLGTATKVTIKPMEEAVLTMKKEDFLKWVASYTDAQDLIVRV